MGTRGYVSEALEVAGANGISRVGYYEEDEIVEEVAVELEDGSMFILYAGNWKGLHGIDAMWPSEGEERVARKKFTWFEVR